MYTEKLPAALKRMLAILLAVAMAAGYFPADARAADAQDDDGLYGTMEFYSTYDSGNVYKTGYYFSDKWFLQDPKTENDALALASMQLTGAAVDGTEDGRGAAFLKKLGFSDIGFSGFDSADPDDCAYTWAKKTITGANSKYTLVAVNIQSYSFDDAIKEKGWVQNFTVNGKNAGGEHYAFALAADKVIDKIRALGGSASNVKYWISGQSRAGAIANLIAERLSKKTTTSGIYAYTFESPAVTDAASAKKEPCTFIHNYLCSDDIVTKVPAWGMTRYGVTHDLTTEATTSGIKEQLKRMGSSLVDVELAADTELVSKALANVPDRKEYSEVRTDTFTDEDGKEISVSFSYQEQLVKATKLYYNGEFDKYSLSGLMDHLNSFLPAIYPLADGAKKDKAGQDPCADYWKAAGILYECMKDMVGELGFTRTDLYSALRLLATTAVDTDYEPVGDQFTDALYYLNPVIEIISNAKAMVFSHHFESLIGRLIILSPLPEVNEIDLTMEEPAAGESTADAIAELKAGLESKGLSWISIEEAEWKDGADTFADNSEAYLDLTFKIEGHTVTTESPITINGKAAETWSLGTSYEDGVDILHGTWKFTIGDPSACTVTFDNNGHGSTEGIESMELPYGTRLQAYEAPEMTETVSEGDETWRFAGWYDAATGGNKWEDVTITGDTVMYAHWVKQIKTIDVDYPVPYVGDKPVENVTIAEKDGYKVVLESTVDSDYKDVAELEEGVTYTSSIRITITDPENYEFALKEGKYGHSYSGVVRVNGQEVKVNYDEEGNSLTIPEYSFVPQPKAEPAAKQKQPMVVKQKVKQVKLTRKALKKKARNISLGKYARVTKNQGKVTYIKTKGNKKFKVNRTTGLIKVAKGTGKGTYKLKIKITAAGNETYSSGSKTIALKVRVK